MSEPRLSDGGGAATVVALVRDLMFVGRIVAEARAAGVAITIVRDAAALADAPPATMLMADLNLPGAIDAVSNWAAANAGRPVVGFAAHTDATTISAARAAGIGNVLARSAFVTQLPSMLGHLRQA